MSTKAETIKAYNEWIEAGKPAIKDYDTRCLVGIRSKLNNPGFFYCPRCNLSFHEYNNNRTVMYEVGRGITVLCSECWSETSLAERVAYAMAIILVWWPPKDHHLVIEVEAAIRGGDEFAEQLRTQEWQAIQGVLRWLDHD